MRLIVGISGATGSIYGIRMLEALKKCGVETHLILTDSAKRTINLENDYNVDQVEAMATKVYDACDIRASIASGSFKTDGMIIAPCAIKSLSALAESFNNNLLVRAADVTLKEKRKLVVIVRETPVHIGHLRLMTRVAEIGGIILPPMPAFYHLPQTLEDIISQTVGKALDQFKIEHDLFRRWTGAGEEKFEKLERWQYS